MDVSTKRLNMNIFTNNKTMDVSTEKKYAWIYPPQT
jgi:hypothetical protein